MPEPTVTLAIVGAIILWPAVFLALRYVRVRRHQRRLDSAFERGLRVQNSGTGEMGQPRPLHGEHFWSDRRSG
ncbi:MAG: hypothetical protein H7840_09670 [Alphaproteobacteria bacterium]